MGILLNAERKINLHTHSTFCDGKDQPEEMVKKALELGFEVLGFSGHGYCVYDEDCCMSRENELRYRDEILALKKKYAGKIDIRLGVERDYFGEDDGFPYDYVIGSVHYVEKDGKVFSVDDTSEIMECGVKDCFNGDYFEYAKAYFDLVSDLPNKWKPDIIGHFDLVCKFNRGMAYFDEKDSCYRELALNALKKILAVRAPKRDGIKDILQNEDAAVFEINTGAMAKGYLDRPYPDKYLIGEIIRSGGKLILSSDCHNKDYLEYAFDDIKNELLNI